MRHTLTARLRHLRAGVALLAVMVLALIVGAFGIIPVQSQTQVLGAVEMGVLPPDDDPWHQNWEGVASLDVPLTEQNISLPFGGGTVSDLVVRAAYDDERLMLLLEWEDDSVDETVNSVQAFSDAAAVQFPPSSADGTPPFTMGGPGAPVNIWQWKAVWQADIDSGFTTMQSRYPNTTADFYPDSDDTLYRPAERVGNPLAQRDHASPVENLIAEGFGTLTHADLQDVAGTGEWREGRWRALFVRQLEAAAEDQADFAVGQATNVAFAVWDGGSGDRNGQKSIAPFVDLTLGSGTDIATEDDGGFGGVQILIISVIVVMLVAGLGVYLYASTRDRPEAA